jgi:hypothetical protein
MLAFLLSVVGMNHDKLIASKALSGKSTLAYFLFAMRF